VKDVFELITRAETRGDFEVRAVNDVEGIRVPGPPLSLSCFYFEVSSKSTGGCVRLRVREGVIPDEFFELVRRTHSDDKASAGPDSRARFAELKDQVMKAIATMPIGELFSWDVTPGTKTGAGAS
jgi:hypothetical protein